MGDKDRVVVASRFADGSPAQTPDFDFIGDKDVSQTSTERQLTQQAVSAVDVEMRGATTGGLGTPAAGDRDRDPAVQDLKDAHDAAAKAAKKQAAKEVNERHVDRDETTGKGNPAAPRGRASESASSDASGDETAKDGAARSGEGTPDK